MQKELVMYSRTYGCPLVSLAKRVLTDYGLSYREVFIDKDETARERVRHWTGFLSVPTLVVANAGEDTPFETPAPLQPGSSPRGIDRGAMITEPNVTQLTDWLQHHNFLKQEDIVG